MKIFPGIKILQESSLAKDPNSRGSFGALTDEVTIRPFLDFQNTPQDFSLMLDVAILRSVEGFFLASP